MVDLTGTSVGSGSLSGTTNSSHIVRSSTVTTICYSCDRPPVLRNNLADVNLDHNLYNIDGLAIATESPFAPHRYYLTKRGANLFIPAGADIGDMVRSHVSDEDNEEGSVELDKIVALANATRIEN